MTKSKGWRINYFVLITLNCSTVFTAEWVTGAMVATGYSGRLASALFAALGFATPTRNNLEHKKQLINFSYSGMYLNTQKM
jgi:hypothetical protein